MTDHTRQRDEIKNKIREAKVREVVSVDRRKNDPVRDHGRINFDCKSSGGSRVIPRIEGDHCVCDSGDRELAGGVKGDQLE